LRYLTVAEYAAEQGISVAAVYKKIQKNKVKTTKKEHNNQFVTFVIGDSGEEGFKPHDNHEEQNNLLQVEHVKNHANNDSLIDFMREMTPYIQLAGQAKLLEDSERRTKQQYFELVQENAQIKTELKLLKEKLQTQEENTKPSSWWRKL